MKCPNRVLFFRRNEKEKISDGVVVRCSFLHRHKKRKCHISRESFLWSREKNVSSQNIYDNSVFGSSAMFTRSRHLYAKRYAKVSSSSSIRTVLLAGEKTDYLCQKKRHGLNMGFKECAFKNE